MEKKEMKWYESPAMEIVNIKLQGMLCESPGGGHVDDLTDITGGNEDPDF